MVPGYARGRIRPVLLRGGAAALAALAAAAVHSTHDPGVVCPFRLLTGIPCPVCGSTTLFIDLGQGRPVAALLANPVTAVAGLALLLGPLGVEQRWRALPKQARVGVLLTAAALSWLWQLRRLGLLPY
ncbi:DUF2752 domain-containing protein [Streptacidiphilus sp. EB129]|uniref:DUF2752 domain-containing protein n=1 Tax=Streptacidiphilus sp. EB129 TaxID=3156262 RepID=UPI003511C2B0